jgi:hypothetical protein
MLAHFAKLEADKKEKARIEYEAKMAPRRHFDESAGETAENRRPFSLMVLVDQKNRDAKGQRQMYVIFPPGITMGKSKLNTLELNGPKSADSANINVQDQECMLRYEDSKHARLIIDRRTLRNTRIVVNHELAGIRKGKTEELDMQRPVLKDDDHLQVGYNHYRLEMGHEFTYAAIRPHALKYLREIMEVLVLYSAEGDQGDIKNAEETLTYFVQKGILTEEEVAEERAIHERIKYINETSQAIDPNMKKITREDKASLDYVLGSNATLPYDAGDIVQAMAVAGMQFLHWHQTEWSQESYRLRLTESIQARVSAYEKKLAEIQAEMRKPKFAKRLSSVISKNAQKDYESEQENLRTTLRRIIVELVTLLKYPLPGIGNRVGWLSGRLDAKEYQQAEEIMEVQEVFDSLGEEKAPNNQQILKLRKIGETRKYSEFCAGGAGISDEPMGKVLDKKVKATATKFLSNARGGKHVSIYLDLLQEMIIDQIITFEDLGSSFEEFTEMRDAERYFNKVKEGEKMLKEIMAAGEENLEAVLDLAKKIDNDEVALGDEQQQQFRAYYLAGFANIFRDARQGAQAEYAATLARAAIRMGLATTEDFGITQEELENFSVTGERPEEDENFADQATEELSEQEKEISELINAVKRSEAHNIEPLINLLQYVHGHEDCTFQEEKITGILERMTIEKLHQIATSQEDMELGEMIVADMRDMGLEAIIEKEMERMVDQIIDWLVQGTKGTEAIKEIVETFSRLNLYDLMTSKVEGLKQQHLKQLLGDEEAVEKLIEDLKIVGLN